MSVPTQRRGDPIHEIFRKLREGFSDIVVSLVGRVERRIELFIDDERHQPPDMDRVVTESMRDAVGVFSSAIPRQHSGQANHELLGENTDDDL